MSMTYRRSPHRVDLPTASGAKVSFAHASDHPTVQLSAR